MTDDDLPPGQDISVARNYRDGAVWVTMNGYRRLLPPETARDLADQMEEKFDVDGLSDQGYQTKELVDELRAAADDVE